MTRRRYCVWFAVGGNQWVERVGTYAEAIERFRTAHSEFGFTTVKGIQQSTLDLYPICADCAPMMNFHDYPKARFVIGARGGIARESV